MAVVTTFDPGVRLQEVLAAVSPQVDRTIVVDDGSSRPPASIDGEAIELLRHDGNLGIAAALNTGIVRAMVHGADFVVTVDQDSVLDERYVAHALDCFTRLERTGHRVAAVGAWVVEPGAREAAAEVVVQDCRGAIQSGLVMPTAVLRRLGPYRESLFIDCVEAEYVLRARRRGLITYVARGCRIDHRLGDEHEVTVLGRTIRFPLHSPTRRYYITRNRLWLTLHYGAFQPVWTVRQWKEVLRVFFLSVVSPEGGMAHVRAAVAGTRDFLLARSGRFPVPRRRERTSLLETSVAP